MHRRIIILLAILAAFLGALIPVGLSLYLSRRAALDSEQLQLQRFANEAIKRTDRVLNEARGIFTKHIRSISEVCSPEHINLMRELTFGSHYIREMGFLKNGVVLCTSWGNVADPIQDVLPDFVGSDNTRIWFKTPTQFSRGKGMLIIQRDDHNIVIDPNHLVDVLTASPHRSLAVMVSGANEFVLGTLHNPPLERMRRYLIQPKNPIQENYIFANARSTTFPVTAIASSPRAEVAFAQARQMRIAIPIGVMFGVGSVALVVFAARQKLSLAAEIKAALRRGEFMAYYQPLVSLQDGRCIGAEVLIRWRRSNGELIAPDVFIPVAEESGSIHAISDYMIHQAVKELGPFLEKHPEIHIALNLTADDFSGRIVNVIATTIKGTAIRPEQLWLEATERSLLNTDEARSTIAHLRSLGHVIVIDDFGTGYSSLSYLHHFRTDALKIDKSFVAVIGMDTTTSGVTPHIIEMAKTLDMEIIAEGLETEEQFQYLLEHGVEYGQGWYFAEAMPAGDFIHYARRSPVKPSTV